MPAPILKFITQFNQDQGWGWSEVHFKQAGEENPNLASYLDAFELNVLANRRLLLGEDCNIVGMRVSYPRDGAIASMGRRQLLPGVSGKQGASPDTSLAIVFKDASFTKTKILHLRGYWDAVEADGSYHPEFDPDWTPNLIGFKNALIAGGYGWPSKDVVNSRRGTVNNYTQLGSFSVELALDAPGMVGVPANTILPIRFSRINRSSSPLNRLLLCTVVDATTLVTVNQVGVAPFAAKGRFNFRATSLVAYFQTASISIGGRRMGRPLNRIPGRSKAKPLA